MMNNRQLGIYIHIPFCMKKCVYCDFLSAPADEETQKKYVQSLIREIGCADEIAVSGFDIRKHLCSIRKDQVTSVYIGGGTPSCISPDLIAEILNAIRRNFDVCDDAEISMECNPKTLDRKKAEIYRKAGINRLSLGLQSTSDRDLKLLGRIHTFEDFKNSFEIARRSGFDNINVDLISALPGQTVSEFLQVLRETAAFEPEHLSVYSLIVEEGTYLYDHLAEYPPLPAEDDDREMYAMAGAVMSAFQYQQYEISNYAKKGYECRHNLKYWERCNYLGFGAGAASLYDNVRFSNIRDVREYIKQCSGSFYIRENAERLTVEDAMAEFMFLGLRKTTGIEAERFKKLFGRDIESVYGQVLRKNIAHGLLGTDGERIYLTPRGIDISNVVMADFLQ